MRSLFFLTAVAMLLISGCPKNNQELIEKIAKLEERVALLEKKIPATPPPPSAPAAEPEQASAYDLPVGKSYVWGNPNAPVTLTKFSDFQCPFCGRANESFVEKIFSDPELKDKVKVVFKHFPLSFHKAARPASKAALAAGEQGHECFWEMAKKLYTGQKELTDENFKKWAKEIKCVKTGAAGAANLGPLNADKFWADYTKKDADYEKMIKDDMDLGMNLQTPVRGTPSFFLNGWRVKQRSIEAVKQLIQEKKLLAGKN